MLTVQYQVSTIEFSLVEVSVLHGLQQGNEVLKEIHKEMNVETVEKLLDETAEAQAYQREIDDMLANSLAVEDEEAVQAELAQLQREAMGEAEPERPLELPSVPSTGLATRQAIVEEETPAKERVLIAA
ncbi:hypothetical protein EW026_g2536 [Hermanssonia centrifuga]|uniref:Charged multivesicular body protein 6 n=1 Tax=Hermanssonia centrifuga TaxID=98765 RepID=A0A4S4KNZ8_9APHY|nr:hypothetical protein EW026_g2536 [Hermanssonia centrifuga]